MREGRGMNAIASHRVGDENFLGIDTDIRDGVGGSKERWWNSAPCLVTETTLPEPSSTKSPFPRS